MISFRPPRRWWIGVAAGIGSVAAAALLSACTGDSVRHPLDDSETKPADIDVAMEQATAVMDDVTVAVLADATYDDDDWSADDGCATNPDSPEQGDVSRILYRTFPTTPSGTTAADIVAATEAHWESAGHTVGPGAPDMAPQAITRIDGIGYSVVEAEPSVELRAFIPCFST